MRNQKMKAVRKAQGMTLTELAGRSGVSLSYVEKLDSGWVIPSRDVALKIAKAFGCTVADLFPEEQLKEAR